jgi:8-oxo-dGTP diphosphatase
MGSEPQRISPRQRPKKRIAVGLLVRDRAGAVLVVRPTYTEGWLLPGGHLETGESPLSAAVREVREELGLTLKISRMLCLDWIPERDSQGDAVIVVFDGGILEPATSSRIHLPDDELDDWRFVGPDDLDGFLPAGRASQIRACLEALRNGSVAILEDGLPVE